MAAADSGRWSMMAALLVVLGLVVGSFLNVCIHRLPRRESLARPGSHCTTCHRPLSWFENVPVVSWLALRGRCRTCRVPISPMYPVVELITAVVFLAGYRLHGLSPLLVVRLVFACAMIVLFAVDFRHRILPNVITLPGVVVGFVASIWLPPGWASSAIGLALGGGILLAIGEVYFRIRGIEGMGVGDMKMLAMIGAFLGWRSMLLTLALASLSGAIVGVALSAAGRGGMKLALPFGTFLAVGALIAAAAGDEILAWYFGLYR